MSEKQHYTPGNNFPETDAGPTVVVKGGSLSASNARWIVGLVIGLASTATSVGASYLVNRAVTDYRITDTEHAILITNTRIDKMAVDVEEMKLNGHADHERRIAKLEGIGPDRTAQMVLEQSGQIAKLAESVSKDHDSIVRILTIMEKTSGIGKSE